MTISRPCASVAKLLTKSVNRLGTKDRLRLIAAQKGTCPCNAINKARNEKHTDVSNVKFGSCGNEEVMFGDCEYT